MKHTVELEFKVGDRVLVKEIQRPGRVEMIQLDFLGIQYRIAFWDNAKRESCWLYADEIEQR